MFFTKNKLNAALLVAVEAQKKHEQATKEKYDQEQRIEAVIQRAEQQLNRELPRKEVRHVLALVWPA